MRSLSELDDALAADLAWRRTEMQSMLAAVRSSTGPAGAAYRRGGVAMLYAHWEGYTKNALSYYWKYVARKRLAYKDLALNFVALGIERELSRLQAINQTERQMARVRRMAECNDDRALMTDREIDTQANLNSDVLSELFAKLGLDVVQFATKQPFIDFSLLRARNSIAHGEYLDVSAESYSEAHHEVLGLLAAVRNAVSNSAALGTFRR